MLTYIQVIEGVLVAVLKNLATNKLIIKLRSGNPGLQYRRIRNDNIKGGEMKPNECTTVIVKQEKDIERLFKSRTEMLDKINGCIKDIKELFAYVEHNADYADQLRIDLGYMIEQHGKEIEKLSERITKFHDDACHDYEDVIDRVEKLEKWEHKLDEISKELILEEVEELKDRIEELEKALKIKDVEISAIEKTFLKEE